MTKASAAPPPPQARPRSAAPAPPLPPLGGTRRRKGEEDDALQKEYIYNLQQQIHFLELESQLLREKALDPGPALKNKGTDMAAEVLGEPTDLDDPIKTLKANYIRAERLHKDEMKKMQETNDKLQQENATLVHTQRRLGEDIALAEQKLSQVHQEFADEKAKLVAEIVDLQQTAQSLRDEIRLFDERVRKLSEERDSLLVRSNQCDSKMEEMTRTMKQKDEAVARIQEQIGDLRSALSNEKGRVGELEAHEQERATERAALQAEIKKNLDDKFAVEIQLRQVTHERDQMRAAKEAAEATGKQLVDSNTQLQKTIETLQTELVQEKRQVVYARKDQRAFIDTKQKLIDLERWYSDQLKMLEMDAESRKQQKQETERLKVG